MFNFEDTKSLWYYPASCLIHPCYVPDATIPDMRIAAVIPVYNEGERVLSVTEAVLGTQGIDEVIVVNDGSNDHTAALLSEQDDLVVLTHERNRGKGEALDTGMHVVQSRGYDVAVFLDGDLQGLESDHVKQLLRPLEDKFYMSVGHFGLRRAGVRIPHFNSYGLLSGQRAIRTSIWGLLSSEDKRGWNIEAALNLRVRRAGLPYTHVKLTGLGHITKKQKEKNWHKAALAYGRTYGAALLTYARIGLEGQNK